MGCYFLAWNIQSNPQHETDQFIAQACDENSYFIFQQEALHPWSTSNIFSPKYLSASSTHQPVPNNL
jgi:hypothetical protein